MLHEKFFATSLTMIGALVALIVQLGPLVGIQLSAEDGNMINEQVDTIVTSLGALVAMYGRVRANSTLTLLPKKKDTTIKAHWAVSAAALLLIIACTPVGGVTVGTPAQELYSAKSKFAVVQEEAAAYASLPFCSDTVPVGCADPKLVVQLDEASDLVEASFASADAILLDPAASSGAQLNTVRAATTALRALTAALVAAQLEAGADA